MTGSKPIALAGALGHVASDKRVEILRRVGDAGSISQAARDCGVSYKAAWQALDTLSNLAGAPLVERAVGGTGGGGARITPAGRQLLRAADAMQRARRTVLRDLAHGTPAAGLALRTSMRNQLRCTVGRIRPEAGAMRVELALAGGAVLASRITRESVQLLDLRAGREVWALCKATAVALARAPRVAAEQNRLEGTIARISRAAAGGEFALTLAGGGRLVGFAPGHHGLRVGSAAAAVVAESAVVIALD